MIPSEAPLQTTPVREPVWDYHDLFVFIGLFIFSALGLNLLGLLFVKISLPYTLLGIQVVWYLISLGAIAAILRLRYDRPFWPSMGWIPPRFDAAIVSFVVGPVLAIALGLLGMALRTKPIPLPFEKLLHGAPLIVLFGILVVVVGPLCEELIFRGFIMPLLIRSLGAIAGILITGLLFGLLHGFEYPDWRLVLLVSTAGAVFGWRRYQTGSTTNSTLMHAGFNLIQYIGLIASERGSAHI